LRTQRIMAAKLTRLAHKIAIQLHLVAENCKICGSRFRRSVRNLFVTPSHGESQERHADLSLPSEIHSTNIYHASRLEAIRDHNIRTSRQEQPLDSDTAGGLVLRRDAARSVPPAGVSAPRLRQLPPADTDRLHEVKR